MDTNHTTCCCTDECFNRSSTNRCIQKCCTGLQWDVKLISCLTDPARWLISVTQWCKNPCCAKGCEVCFKTFDFVYSPIVCLFVIPIYLIVYCFLAAACLLKFFLVDLSIFFIWPHCRDKKLWKKALLSPLRLLTLVIIMIFTGMIFISVLYLVASMTLNAEYFNPFIAPFFTLMGYFWKNWKSSVEAKCLELKTLIIEVSKEKAGSQRDKQNLGGGDAIADASNNNESVNGKHRQTATIENTDENTNHELNESTAVKTRPTTLDRPSGKKKNAANNCLKRCPTNSCTKSTDEDKNIEMDSLSGLQGNTNTSRANRSSISHENTVKENNIANNCENIIKFDKHGEAMISKELYKTISKKFFYLDHLLFYFFRRVIFVGLYAFGVLTVMILGRDSGVSGIAQIMGAILAGLIPFVFDTIFAEQHLSQKTSKGTAIRQKLESMLNGEWHPEKEKIILVELDNNNYNGESNTINYDNNNEESNVINNNSNGESNAVNTGISSENELSAFSNQVKKYENVDAKEARHYKETSYV